MKPREIYYEGENGCYNSVKTILLIIVLVTVSAMCFAQVDNDRFKPKHFDDLPVDTAYKYYVGADSFLIRYTYTRGVYMSPLVGRMICEIDSVNMDTVCVIDGSTGTEREEIWFGRKNCREDTAAYRRDRHYDATIQVYRISKGKRYPVGKKMFGYYVDGGCFEDVPKSWVMTALKYDHER